MKWNDCTRIGRDIILENEKTHEDKEEWTSRPRLTIDPC